jgi:putative FmdB family regulatory protein
MPTYAYTCGDCSYRFDARQAFTDAPLDECPRCTGTIRRVFGPAVVVFRGSGFYSTDRSAS